MIFIIVIVFLLPGGLTREAASANLQWWHELWVWWHKWDQRGHDHRHWLHCQVYDNKYTFVCIFIFLFFYFSKDNPLEFTFWRKMLRDVREQLKADALAKLMASCPTLFSMGWFKENLPKTEEEITKEDNDFSIQDKNHKHSLINWNKS